MTISDDIINVFIIGVILFAFFFITYIFNSKRSSIHQNIDRMIGQLNEHTTSLSTAIERAKLKIDQDENIDNQLRRISALIESMDYADTFIHLARKINIDVIKKPSENILNFLEEQRVAKKQTQTKLLIENNILSFPYWALTELVDEEDIILPLNNYIENINERIRLDYSTTFELVSKNEKTYGIPFSKITGLLAYNTNFYKIEPNSYEEIIEVLKESEEINFGFLENVDARSYYYYFFIICGSYGIEPLVQIEGILYHNFNDEKVYKALFVFFELLKYSKLSYGTWNDQLSQLKDGSIQTCFIWSEQLSEVIEIGRAHV